MVQFYFILFFYKILSENNPKIAGIAFNGTVSVWVYCLNELSTLILLKSMSSLYQKKFALCRILHF